MNFSLIVGLIKYSKKVCSLQDRFVVWLQTGLGKCKQCIIESTNSPLEQFDHRLPSSWLLIGRDGRSFCVTSILTVFVTIFAYFLLVIEKKDSDIHVHINHIFFLKLFIHTHVHALNLAIIEEKYPHVFLWSQPLSLWNTKSK